LSYGTYLTHEAANTPCWMDNEPHTARCFVTDAMPTYDFGAPTEDRQVRPAVRRYVPQGPGERDCRFDPSSSLDEGTFGGASKRDCLEVTNKVPAVDYICEVSLIEPHGASCSNLSRTSSPEGEPLHHSGIPSFLHPLVSSGVLTRSEGNGSCLESERFHNHNNKQHRTQLR
jgi:hypothetical protein